jgi:phage shock protein C
VLAGVCGGLGRYFDVDPVLFRIGFVVLTLAGGFGILAYVLAWIFIPRDEPLVSGEYETAPGDGDGATIAGLVFVVIGAFLLARAFAPDVFEGRYVWPAVLIAIGLALLARAGRR